MLYVEQSLGPDEELIHVGQFHWMHDVRAFMSIIWGIIGSVAIIIGGAVMYFKLGKLPYSLGYSVETLDYFGAMEYLHPGLRIASLVAFLVGVLSFAQMMVFKATTEIAITNRRLIFKQGLLARSVGEMAIDRIEGVNVLQSLFGRLFDYARLAVRGMGVGEVLLPAMEKPLAFRQAIERARQESRNSKNNEESF